MDDCSVNLLNTYFDNVADIKTVINDFYFLDYHLNRMRFKRRTNDKNFIKSADDVEERFEKKIYLFKLKKKWEDYENESIRINDTIHRLKMAKKNNHIGCVEKKLERLAELISICRYQHSFRL